MNIIEKVLKTVRCYDMVKPGDTILAAVSGGPDSVFLLHALKSLKNKLKIKEIVVCNIDHGLRGSESEDDSLFVKNTVKELCLKLFYKKIDLSKAKAQGLSTEEAAREERYKFFKEAARSSGALVIATGHTLCDQAETILMRIVKGASLKGIVGIAPARDEGDLRIIRPLIELEKDEITGYLEEKGMPYRIDRTNIEPIYFRNIVRREIIPFLEKYNPRLKKALFNLAEHLREDFDFIAAEKTRARDGMTQAKGGKAEVELKDIAVQPRAIQKEILRDLLEKSGGEVKKLSFKHWKEMEALVKHKRKGSSVHLPGGVKAMRTGKAIIFARI